MFERVLNNSTAVSISCIVIRKDLKIKHTNTNLFKDFSGESLILISYNSCKKNLFQNTFIYQKPL